MYTSEIHFLQHGSTVMEINTSRFGQLEIEDDSVIRFPTGLLGMEDSWHWVLLADVQNGALAWLQSVDRPELAFAVVSPQCFVPCCRLRIARRELLPLELDDIRGAEVLAIVNRSERGLTLNLKAPVVINPQRRLGRQVVTNGDLPLQYDLGDRKLGGGQTALRKIA